jgi:hypothetical protein
MQAARQSLPGFYWLTSPYSSAGACFRSAYNHGFTSQQYGFERGCAINTHAYRLFNFPYISIPASLQRHGVPQKMRPIPQV